ncbi:MAG: DNA gyrase inhibitor YacG [Fimbriiglobus sp.]
MTCPICDHPMPANWMEYPEYPFCTKRCKLIDLGRWLSEDYKIPDNKPQSQSSETKPVEE